MTDSTDDRFAVRLRQALPAIATVIFFVLGFALHGWAWAWLVFLVIPIGYSLLRPAARGVDLHKDQT